MPQLKGKVVCGESCLECDFVLTTETQDSDIRDMISQPFALEVLLDSRIIRWIPDYLIERQDGSRELIEVKLLEFVHPKDQARKAGVRALFTAYDEAARASGYRFRLVTEQEIRVQPLLHNAKLMHRHSGPFGDKALILRGILSLRDLPRSPIVRDLGNAISRPDAALEIAIRLDRLGHIRLDRTRRLSTETAFQIVSSDVEAFV